MGVSSDDVRHIASLARLGVTDAQAERLTSELNAILSHMDVLSRVDTEGVQEAIGVGARGLPARADSGPPVPLARSIEAFAPSVREGFLLVPRLASHESSGDA